LDDVSSVETLLLFLLCGFFPLGGWPLGQVVLANRPGAQVISSLAGRFDWDKPNTLAMSNASQPASAKQHSYPAFCAAHQVDSLKDCQVLAAFKLMWGHAYHP